MWERKLQQNEWDLSKDNEYVVIGSRNPVFMNSLTRTLTFVLWATISCSMCICVIPWVAQVTSETRYCLLCFSVFLSLSLSVSLTHTHTQTHDLEVHCRALCWSFQMLLWCSCLCIHGEFMLAHTFPSIYRCDTFYSISFHKAEIWGKIWARMMVGYMWK